jgi:DNA-binding PadR family transcriptional regulator
MARKAGRAGPAGDVTRLTLLGLLSSKPMHGYELRQQMRVWSMEHWVDIHPGSIYSALPRMASEGLLQVTEVSHEGNRPQRTVYGITAAGRAELTRLLADAWTQPASMAQPVDVALFFIWLLPPEVVAARLAERVAKLDGAQEQLARNRALWNTAVEAAPENVPLQYFEMMQDLFEHSERVLDTERQWSAGMLTRVQSGVFDFEQPASSARPARQRKRKAAPHAQH